MLEQSRNWERKTKKTPRMLLFMFAVISLTTIGYFLFLKPSEEMIPYFSEENPIFYQGDMIGLTLRSGDEYYIPIALLDEYFPDLLFFDEKSGSYIVATNADVIQIIPDETSFWINGSLEKVQNPPLFRKEEEVFLSLDWLKNYYPIQYNKIDANGIWIFAHGDEDFTGIIQDKKGSIHNYRLRSSQSLKSPYYAEVTPGEKVYIEDETEDFYLVRKENGIGGYIKKKLISNTDKGIVQIPAPREVPLEKEAPSPIHLTWEAVYSVNPDPKKLPDMPGVNVVSPTWFHLLDESGNLNNLASKEYSNWAKERGYQVWGLFSNNFDPELTHLALKNYETRQKIITQLIGFAKEYHLDGINFDIENVNLEDAPYVTQLMKEATPLLHRHNLIVSMDITFISDSENWSLFYEREKLAEVVDYLIVMAYDQHTNGSGVAGSVSSLPWVENNLLRLLEEVPNYKLVLGIPFYTRLWEEKLDENGNKTITSKALTMNQAKAWIDEHNLEPVYDPESEQNYVEMTGDDGTVYKMWLEDATSMKKRAEIARSYNLAGIAGWSRYFANDDAWVFLHDFYINASEKIDS